MKIVIKIGGSLFSEDLTNLYKDVKELIDNNHSITIVHGGGPQINSILESSGEKPRYLFSPSGMKSRHTNEKTQEAAIMALGGLVNKKMTAALQANGVNAFGFTGVDGKVFVAKRKEKILSVDPESGKRRVIRNDYSGKISPESVNAGVVNLLLDNGFVPVIGALAIGEKHEVLNTDGDRAASSICKAIQGDLLVSVTDVPGVLKDMKSREVIPSLHREDLDGLMERVKGGMRKKIFAVKEALDMGIPRFIITSGLVESGISHALEGKMGTNITP
ncbi:MAG: [LysW]-aminoadipate kinase [Promethearchaeota archaeon]